MLLYEVLLPRRTASRTAYWRAMWKELNRTLELAPYGRSGNEGIIEGIAGNEAREQKLYVFSIGHVQFRG